MGLKKSKIAQKIIAATLIGAIMGTSFVGLSSILNLNANAVSSTTTDYGLAASSQEGVILHCWNWSYKNIKKYMKDIAAAGYTSIQTSPVQQPKDYYWQGVAYGNVGIPNGTGGEDGNWWKAYQPVTFSICDNGYTWYGNKTEFKEMCAEAEKYGVKVIVDIVANHMGNIQGYKIGSAGNSLEENQKAVMDDISRQVGEFWNPDMLTDPSYWHISTSWTHTSDGRFDVTQGNMGMPDLNTGDTKVQQMVLGLLKECIDCGADGFRFDAAKHIETPADNQAFASDFWNVVLDGARSYYKQKNGYDGIYFYGEVLNRLDDTNAENYYLSKMSLTDNSTSDNLRNSVMHGSVSALNTSNYCGYIHGQGNKAVLWAESHDTYMGGGSSYDANDSDIKKTWAIIASRKDSTGLFFARPYYSKDILSNDVSKARQSSAEILSKIEQTQLGDVGTLTWADPAVVAVNRFRNYFVGQSEKLGSSGNTAYNVRGKTGIVIVRGEGTGAVSLNVGMTDGTYYDQVTGEAFTVSNGVIKGNIKNADGIAVVYNPSVDYGKVTPEQPTVLKISATTDDDSQVFYQNSIDVTMKAENAKTVKYTTSEGTSGTFTSSKTITVGSLTATGENVVLTIDAEADDGTKKSKTYIYSKKAPRSGYPTLNSGGIVFDNQNYNWAKVYCYVYTENSTGVKNNGGWPGVEMTDEGGDYWTYEIPETLSGDVYVIFSNGSGVQYPSGTGLSMSSTDKKLFTNGALQDLPASTSQLSISLNASSTKVALGQSVTLTAKATSSTGTVKYKFIASDGTTIQSSGTSNTCTWTPKKVGTYIVAVNGIDSKSDITATAEITVVSSGSDVVGNSSVSSDSINLGSTVTLKGSGVGGQTPYQYSYYVKKSTATKWTQLKSYSTTSQMTYKPAETGEYQICIKVKDSSDTEDKQYFNLTVTSSNLKNTSKISSSSVSLGKSVTVTASATGGAGSYKYAVFYKKTTDSKWVMLQDYSTNSSVSVKPESVGTYSVCAKVKDNAGVIEKQYFDLTVTSNELTNTSKISSTSVIYGNSVKVTASATGGSGSYKYAVFYKKTTDSKWTMLQDYGTNATVSVKPARIGQYRVCVKVKDSSNTISKLYFNLESKLEELKNNSKISSTSITLGNTFKVSNSATGGTGSYKYAVFYKRTTDSKWNMAMDYTTKTSVTIKPAYAAKYSVCAKVKDSNGTIVKKYFSLTVNK